jgi:hypothetical protein
MHIKIEISTSLPTHRVARAVWVPEFYTLEELSKVLQAALGWEEKSTYLFRSDEVSWLPCEQFEDDVIEEGQFLAEGTAFSEVIKFWEEDGAVFQCGNKDIWEFSLKIQDMRDTHPDNLTCILLDGLGDMPVDLDDMRKLFLEVHEKFIDEDFLVMNRTVRPKPRTEMTLGYCAELVSYRSYEISRARRLPQY